MALSGTFTGGRNGSEPWLTLHWQRIATDIANNRSTIRLTLRLHSQYNIQFSASKNGVLHGSNFTYTSGMAGTNISRIVNTRDVVVTHNADGTKSQSFSASMNLQIRWNDTNRTIGNIYVSGTAAIDRIPRASSISSFGNFTVKNDQTASFTLSLSRASTSFTHNITLRVNGKDIQSWNGQSLPPSLSLTAASSNYILNIMQSATSMTAQLRVQTRSGSTNIGGVVTRDATVSIHSSIVPTIGTISAIEAVTEIRTGIGLFVQSKSKVSISFTTGAGYGARDLSVSVLFDGKTYTAKSFTSGVVMGSGTFPIKVTYKNTRGQSVSKTLNITVYAYSNPKITISGGYRTSSSGVKDEDGEYARIDYSTTISGLNGKNIPIYQIEYKRSNETNFTILTTPANGNKIFLANRDYTYNVRVRVKDFFTDVIAYVEVPSTFTLINFSADGQGMAFGATYDDLLGGLLQIKGVVYIDEIGSRRLAEATDLNTIHRPGLYYESTNARATTMKNLPISKAFSLLVEKHAGTKQTFSQYDSGNPRTLIRNYYNGVWGSWREISFV